MVERERERNGILVKEIVQEDVLDYIGIYNA